MSVLSGGVLPHIGKEGVLQALGKEWRLGRLDMQVWDALLEWARPRMPDPFNGLDMLADRIAKMPPDTPATHPLVALFNSRLSIAQQTASEMLTIESPRFQDLVDNKLEGKVERFYLLLRKNHPDIDRHTAVEILREIGEQREQEAILKASGKMPPQPGNAEAPAA